MISSGNHYIIKEFVIINNAWVGSALCAAAIKTPTSILEFKRRYFYEFDKLSAFLSQLLALKRHNFPNLITFSFIQVGETAYNGDRKYSARRGERKESQLTPIRAFRRSASRINSVVFKSEQLQSSSMKRKEEVEQEEEIERLSSSAEQQQLDEEDEEDASRLLMYVDRIFPECGKTLDEFIHFSCVSTSEEDTLRMVTRGFRIFDAIANTLCKMHRAGFSYRVLRPNMVRILSSTTSKTFTVFLDSPDFLWDQLESDYLTQHV